MKLVGREKITQFMKKHAASGSPLRSWVKEVESAKWKNTSDIKARYSSASFLPKNRVVFNIGGNSFRLVVVVSFVAGAVVVTHIGTHAEYDKWDL